MSRPTFDPDWIPPPGATVEDLLSRAQPANPRRIVADRLGKAEAEKLFTGKLALKSEVAAILADLTGLAASFWLERERLYRAALIDRQAEQEFLATVPVAEMKERSFIQPVESHAETVDEVVRFLNKEDVEACREHVAQLPALIKQKTSQTIVSDPGALAVWIRAGEIAAEKVDCAAFDPTRLKELLPEFRKLTRTSDPQRYLPALRALCQTCGIALIVLRATNGCRARGVVRRLSNGRVMVLLSNRHLSDDQFWFSFFHEVAHLLLHPSEETVDDDWDENIAKNEVEADQYAAAVLIPTDSEAELPTLRDDRSIIAFARGLGISRGIVVGQLQHRKLVGFDWFNHLKIRYEWNSQDEIRKKSR